MEVGHYNLFFLKIDFLFKISFRPTAKLSGRYRVPMCPLAPTHAQTCHYQQLLQ